MDTRGTKILPYMDKMISSFGLSLTSKQDRSNLDCRLSPREQEVVHCVINGSSNKDIARELFLSEATVKKLLSNIFEKLDIKTEYNSPSSIILNRMNTTFG
ncbi:response regulator transcription factor [Cohnella yongneupensis]|uniref:Response regulator transcription factor n=1 Tax=Cohnella yongneupensis TaxID=425006 RepID=A0ABW0QTR4_9BACL